MLMIFDVCERSFYNKGNIIADPIPLFKRQQLQSRLKKWIDHFKTDIMFIVSERLPYEIVRHI